ncbi:MAG: hypothetical protein HS115_11215 [Spirochaetales bacterium]|nr:hypothetical protein [Spirochaetales bacterium]
MARIMRARNYSSRFRVFLWTRKARSLLLEKISRLLPPDRHALLPGFQSIVDELAKNALKANYKYVLIRRRIQEKADPDQMEPICEDALRYNEFLDRYPELTRDLTGDLRRILDQEGLWIKERNRRNEEKAPADKDMEKLSATDEYRAMFREVREARIYLEIRLTLRQNLLFIEVINRAPILFADLNRIHDRRAEFRKFQAAGREIDFFLGHMDGSEAGAGFGYATIDSQLIQMGQDPNQALLIVPLHSTNIMLTINLNTLNGVPL